MKRAFAIFGGFLVEVWRVLTVFVASFWVKFEYFQPLFDRFYLATFRAILYKVEANETIFEIEFEKHVAAKKSKGIISRSIY